MRKFDWGQLSAPQRILAPEEKRLPDISSICAGGGFYICTKGPWEKGLFYAPMALLSRGSGTTMVGTGQCCTRCELTLPSRKRRLHDRAKVLVSLLP